MIPTKLIVWTATKARKFYGYLNDILQKRDEGYINWAVWVEDHKEDLRESGRRLRYYTAIPRKGEKHHYIAIHADANCGRGFNRATHKWIDLNTMELLTELPSETEQEEICNAELVSGCPLCGGSLKRLNEDDSRIVQGQVCKECGTYVSDAYPVDKDITCAERPCK